MSTLPNIVILNPDQMRWDYLSPAGHPFLATQHLSRLAQMGTYLPHTFCTSPMCGPSRTSFLTGRYPAEHGVREYAGDYDPAGPNAMHLLGEAGYQRALFGKDHVITEDAIGVYYDEGEDICLGNNDNHPAYHHSWSSGVLEKGSSWDITERLTDAGLAFIDRQAKQENPFFLTLNYQDPHPFFGCPEPYASLFSPEQFTLPPTFRREAAAGEPRRLSIWREHSESLLATEEDFRRAMAFYAGQVRYVDDQVGRVLAKLEDLDLLQNTLILFWSDHGELLGDFGVTHKLPVFYDCLTRIPAIFYDPGGRVARGVDPQLVESIDLMGTLLDLAGLPQPRGSHARSLAARHQPPRQSVFAEAGLYRPTPQQANPELKLIAPFHPTHHGVGAMLRTADWKVCQYSDDTPELFSLRDDPHENHNRFGDPAVADVQANLLSTLASRLLMQGADPLTLSQNS